MKFKYKVEIVIDEEKVINDDIYDPKEMYEFIRNMFKRFDLAEIKTDKPYHFIFFTYYYMSKSANLQVLRTTKKSRSEPSERLLFKLNKKYLSTAKSE